MIGLPAAEPFPAGGAVTQAALLLGSELAAAAAGQPGGDTEGYSGADRVVAAFDVDAAWRRVTAAYAGRFTVEYRAEPYRLRADALSLLQRVGLVRVLASGDVAAGAALGRYRAAVRLPETLDV